MISQAQIVELKRQAVEVVGLLKAIQNGETLSAADALKVEMLTSRDASGLPTSIRLKTLCDLFDVTPPVIGKLVGAGVVKKNNRDDYDLRVSVRAYVAYLREASGSLKKKESVDSIVESKARLTQAQARKAELMAKQLEGELVNRDSVKAFICEVMVAMRREIEAGIENVETRNKVLRELAAMEHLPQFQVE